MSACRKSCCWTPYTCAKSRACRCHYAADAREEHATTPDLVALMTDQRAVEARFNRDRRKA